MDQIPPPLSLSLFISLSLSLVNSGVQQDRTNSPLLYRRLASYTTVEEKRVELPAEKKEAAAGGVPAAEGAAPGEQGPPQGGISQKNYVVEKNVCSEISRNISPWFS